MALIKTGNFSANHDQHIYTYTRVAEDANDFAAKKAAELLAKDAPEYAEWVDVGDFFPVVIGGIVHYTFTITTGSLI